VNGDQDVLDVLVVGAGPTGLALAAQLRAFGVRFRLVDRLVDRGHESRALAIQPRTLEVLAPFGVTEELVQRGNPAVRVRMHVGHRVVPITLFDIGIADTAYPFLLFLSQAETERVLAEQLDRDGLTVERGVELVNLDPASGLDLASEPVTCRLCHNDGRQEVVRARYVVGCDGAHSTVRQRAGIGFTGHAYPQTFLLADLEVDGLEPDAVHSYLAGTGILFFFPLGEPATWRLLAMRSATAPEGGEVTLAELQAQVDAWASDRLRLRDPVWMTDFRIHLRSAARYRAGRVFLAGDAAHIHSPAGAQGMNTGIQDAINLGWKLALVTRGAANPALLDTYEAERAPVGQMVLRLTNRLFTLPTTANPLIRAARTGLAPRLAPLVLRFTALRRTGLRTVSQLAIRYRKSPASTDGPRSPARGPKAGDRLPDAPVIHNGRSSTLHAALAQPGYHLLLCGLTTAWPPERAAAAAARWPGLLTVHRLGTQPVPGTLHDPDGTALHRLGLRAASTAHYLVRPDGHIGYRAGGTNLAGAHAYLAKWLTSVGR
jgi:2-polyprenyl-6-methoxyphenol hydroxylase-like FAD-dependent oxidoreductase